MNLNIFRIEVQMFICTCSNDKISDTFKRLFSYVQLKAANCISTKSTQTGLCNFDY